MQSKQQSEDIVYNKGGIKITYVGVNMDNSRVEFQFRIENNSANAILVQARDASVNGFMIDGIMSSSIQSGKKVNANLTYLTSLLNKQGIYDIEDIELKFRIMHDENYDEIDTTNIIKIKL